jgi:GntR family transcriptional repressor for pyruvate dehydrogenase complex
MLRVSRPIVREALSVLSHEGTIDIRRGAGIFVRRKPSRRNVVSTVDDIQRVLSEHNIHDLFELRGPLEQQAAFLAAQRATPADLESIVQAHAKMKTRTLRGLRTGEADYAFHYMLAQATHNKIFVIVMDTISNFYAHALDQIKAHSSKAARQAVLAEHDAIARAVLGRNAVAARDAMAHHLSSMQRNLIDGRVSGSSIRGRRRPIARRSNSSPIPR